VQDLIQSLYNNETMFIYVFSVTMEK